jgi:hypothetical protein
MSFTRSVRAARIHAPALRGEEPRDLGAMPRLFVTTTTLPSAGP